MATLKPFNMKGGADVNNAKIINLATPTNGTDAANKSYVDSVVNGKTYSYTTDQISEGTNLYFTATRARSSLSFVAGATGYNSSTGVFTLPTKTSHLTNDSGFLTVESDTLASVTGRGNTTTNTITINNSTASNSSTTGALVVSGGVGIGGALRVGSDLTIGGNLIINGTTTTVNATTVTFDDVIMTLGGDTAPTSSDTKDRGIEYRYYNGTAKTGFFGWDQSTGYFAFYKDSTNSSEIISGTLGDMQAANFRGALIGNADTTTKLATARTISTTGDATWSVSFDGSANASAAITLSNSGVTAGTYNNSTTAITPITVDAKGRITGTGTAVTITPAWSSITAKPTTISGYGIIDAQPLNTNLTSVSNIATNTTGLIKVVNGSYSVDTTAYLSSESDTLATVTSRGGATSTAVTFNGGITTSTVKLTNGSIVDASLTTSTTTANQPVILHPIASVRSVSYKIQITSGSSYHTTTVDVLHDGTNVYMDEYGTMFTGSSLATFDADINSNNLRLLVTPTNAITTIKVIATILNV
jgi:hypothetical protein